jgi:Zn-dependent protease with chaperone function
MDFFQAQERARKRTKWLVFYFALAVLGTILTGYAAIAIILAQAGGRPHRPPRDYYALESRSDLAALPGLWDPALFLLVAGGVSAVVGLGSGYKWLAFRQGGGAVAESVGGRRVEPGTRDPAERRLLNVVEEMAIASGVPVPAVYVLDGEAAINAFAAGLTTHDAVVAVTRGTLEKLSRDELQGVVGHEFSHILNGDMRLNVKLTAIIFGILVIGLIGRGVLQNLGRVRGGGKGKGGAIAVILAIGLALFVIGYVGYFFGRLIQAAVSRQREFLADASAVQFTRNPGGIAGALRKIGADALGSRVEARGAEQLGHFFFAQGFSSFFGSLWATHPPLDERIRAIDVAWDGKFEETRAAAPARPARPPPQPPRRATPAPVGITPVAAIAAIGSLEPEQVGQAQGILAAIPAGLRQAAVNPTTATALIAGLLLDNDAGVRDRQHALLAEVAGTEVRRLVEELAPALQQLRSQYKLPLVQLALPALRQLPPSTLARFTGLYDRLVNADGFVSTFEFALKSLLRRSLAQGRSPAGPGAHVWSFEAVARDIAVVLSTLARTASTDETAATRAMAAGAAQLRLLEGRLALLPAVECDLPRFDTALDRLALCSAPSKQRLLVAGANVVSADGIIQTTEYELLRVVAAALDCPMPPLAAAA